MIEEKENQICELKCRVCGKVCGTVEFPAGAEVDMHEVEERHETYCDEHSVKNNET